MISDVAIETEEMSRWYRELASELRNTNGALEQSVASTIELYDFSLRQETPMSFESSLQYLGTLTNNPDFLAAQYEYVKAHPERHFYTGLPPEAVEWGLRFLEQILAELRKAICSKDSEYSKLKTEYKSYPKAFATALASSTLASIGISGPVALGVATFVLIVLATATKNAFCNMTNQEALEAVRKAVNSNQNDS